MTPHRLDGLDIARFVAFVGMVIVNFKIAMGATGGGLLDTLTGVLEGKAAATFVVLAGVGLGLSAAQGTLAQTLSVTLRRVVFLLALGLLNTLVFDADILHYYAFYFLFGVLLVPLASRWLVLGIVMLNLLFVAMILVFDYDTGWHWATYSYAGFWTPTGFMRNLFFNGWHPVVPWLGFLLFGIVLSRLTLPDRTTQHRLILLGALAVTAAEAGSALLARQLALIDPALAILATTGPVPPMPLYVLAGIGSASVVVGLCLRGSAWLGRTGLLGIVTPAGRQTLTLYLAHILIGMGTLEALGMLGGQTVTAAVAAASLFCAAALVYAWCWSRAFKRGPVEAAMRQLAG
ncbi:MAG: heparan-alpha-glucosaminide N-acetyltransferase domain-containing protein [Rhodocyclaceae bacterium]